MNELQKKYIDSIRIKPRTYVRFSPEEIAFIGANSATMRPSALAEYFGCSSRAVSYQIEKNDFPRFVSPVTSREVAERFICLYNARTPHRQLAEMFNLCTNDIYYIAKRAAEKFNLERIVARGGRKWNKI